MMTKHVMVNWSIGQQPWIIFSIENQNNLEIKQQLAYHPRLSCTSVMLYQVGYGMYYHKLF